MEPNLFSDIGLIIAAYALGCFSPGYYLTRLARGKDIRDIGSGSTGSRNVSRTLGAWGFAVVFCVDVAKGAVALLLATRFGSAPWVTWAALPIVVAGHIWPAQLSFRGGKGLATALGATLVMDWSLLLFGVVLCGLLLIFWRNLIKSGLVAVFLTPLWFLTPVLFPRETFTPPRPLFHILSSILVCAIILFAHRDNIKEDFLRRSAE